MIESRSCPEVFPFRLLSNTLVVADARTPVIARNDYDVCTIEYIQRGSGVLEINGESFQPETDGIYFLHQHSVHRYWPSREQPWHKLCVVVDGPLAYELLRIYRLDRVYYLAEVPQLRKYFEALLLLGHSAPWLHQRAAVVFHQFVEHCFRLLYEPAAVSAAPEALALKKYLDRSLDRRFVLEHYARETGFSAAHLIRSFRAAFGCPPVEYRLRQKLDAARRLLQYTDLSIKEIASGLGFADSYHFSNYFKKHLGYAPSAFRRQRALGK